MFAELRFAGKTRLHCTSMGVGPRALVMPATMKSEPTLNSGSGFEAKKTCAKDEGGPMRSAPSRHPRVRPPTRVARDMASGYWQLGTGSICFAILRCERAGKPSTYTHVRLGLPARSRL